MHVQAIQYIRQNTIQMAYKSYYPAKLAGFRDLDVHFIA